MLLSGCEADLVGTWDLVAFTATYSDGTTRPVIPYVYYSGTYFNTLAAEVEVADGGTGLIRLDTTYGYTDGDSYVYETGDYFAWSRTGKRTFELSFERLSVVSMSCRIEGANKKAMSCEGGVQDEERGEIEWDWGLTRLP